MTSCQCSALVQLSSLTASNRMVMATTKRKIHDSKSNITFEEFVGAVLVVVRPVKSTSRSRANPRKTSGRASHLFCSSSAGEQQPFRYCRQALVVQPGNCSRHVVVSHEPPTQEMESCGPSARSSWNGNGCRYSTLARHATI